VRWGLGRDLDCRKGRAVFVSDPGSAGPDYDMGPLNTIG